MSQTTHVSNIYLLSTDKPSRLFVYDGKLGLAKGFQYGSDAIQNQNIYITNNEEIKEGDWCYHPLLKWGSVIKSKYDEPNSTMKKIILTTDEQLIKDDVQAIDDEFLQWFVKNPSCEEVKWNAYPIDPNGNVIGTNKPYPFYGLISNFKVECKIIIPKEETLRKQFPANVEGSMEFNEMCKEEPEQFEDEFEIAKNLAAIGIGKSCECK